ncbi:MAG: hypothetical protein R3F60_14455 [bacterium]
MGRSAWMLAALAVVGCDDGGGGGGEVVVDAAVVADAGGAGGGGGGEADLPQRYCEGIGTAKCEYVFRCVQGGNRRVVFGLDGPELADCVETEAARCLEDVADRAQRGTLRAITDEEIATCQTRMAGLDCPPGTPSDWVTMFYQFYAQRCTSVGVGNVPEGQPCERRTDCQNRDLLCIDGTCKAARPADIQQDCVASGRVEGALNPDDACPGEVCAQVRANDDDKQGICTADCTEGFGCPSGAYCLQTSGATGVPSWYCTWPCAQDRDCTNGFECIPVDPMEPDGAKHCGAANPPE